MKIKSTVEKIQTEKSGSRIQYSPEEKIQVIVVDNFPHLGTLTALRFIEWTQQHPEGMVSLPTGKTPEYFIHETRRFLETWSRKETQKELADWGIDTEKKPDMRGLSFVQIDEFYPINPLHTNSFFRLAQPNSCLGLRSLGIFCLLFLLQLVYSLYLKLILF